VGSTNGGSLGTAQKRSPFRVMNARPPGGIELAARGGTA
jgi:hypothetical protein